MGIWSVVLSLALILYVKGIQVKGKSSPSKISLAQIEYILKIITLLAGMLANSGVQTHHFTNSD